VSTKPFGRRGLVVLFAIYLVLLAWMVVWKLEVPYVGAAAFLPHPIKLVPFLPSGDAGASAPLEVVANILLFVPVGLYLGLLAPTWRWWQGAAVSVGASLVLEVTQHLLSTGSFDTSDVIANTFGGVVGLALLALARRRLGTRTATVVARLCLVGTVVALLAVAVFVASPMHYRALRDVVVASPSPSR
jgi:glycopeptide antibiotics resistance protein